MKNIFFISNQSHLTLLILFYLFLNRLKDKINLPQKFKNLNDIHIVLSKAHYYDDYEKEKQNNFEYIYINDEKIKNENIIKINLI